MSLPSLSEPVNINICSTEGTIFSGAPSGGGSGSSPLTFLNLGTGGARVYAQTVGNNVQLRRLLQGKNTVLSESAVGIQYDVNDLAFDSTAPVKRAIPGLQGISLGKASILDTLNALLYPTLPPQATLTLIPSQFEFGDANPISANWAATKNDNPIVAISVNSIPITPITGNTQSGTALITKNGTVSVTIPMSVSDSGSTANASAISSVGRKIRIGPSVKDGIIAQLLDSDINGLSGAFATTYTLTPTPFTIPANNYLIIAIPTILLAGKTPVFKINGFINNAFTIVRNNNFVNTFGFSEPFTIWASNQFSTGTIQLEID